MGARPVSLRPVIVKAFHRGGRSAVALKAASVVWPRGQTYISCL